MIIIKIILDNIYILSTGNGLTEAHTGGQKPMICCCYVFFQLFRCWSIIMQLENMDCKFAILEITLFKIEKKNGDIDVLIWL